MTELSVRECRAPTVAARAPAGLSVTDIAWPLTARPRVLSDATGMERTAVAPFSARFPHGVSNAWLARRWYYTARSHRAYSVREISPGDRRLLAEFALGLNSGVPEREQPELSALATMVFDRVIAGGTETAVGFAALENTAAGDRVIGVCAYGPSRVDGADFNIAVASSYREEQIGRTLLSTLVRHAKRAGVRRLEGEMRWSNRPMQMLAMSLGFSIEPLQHDRTCRRLMLGLK